MALYPCAYSMTFNVSGDTSQRHTQSALAGHACGKQLERRAVRRARRICSRRCAGLKAGELVHVIADAHIYDRHVPAIEEIIANPPKAAPRFVIDPTVDDFYKFTRDSFKVEGYEYSEFKIQDPRRCLKGNSHGRNSCRLFRLGHRRRRNAAGRFEGRQAAFCRAHARQNRHRRPPNPGRFPRRQAAQGAQKHSPDTRQSTAIDGAELAHSAAEAGALAPARTTPWSSADRAFSAT